MIPLDSSQKGIEFSCSRWTFRLQANLVFFQIVSGDLRAENVFHPPVRTLVDETIPSVSEPPGNPEVISGLRQSPLSP
jgi:hypothetical protein